MAQPSKPIQQLPQGLLSWLGLKAGGANPDELGGSVIPTLYMNEWYGLQRKTIVSVSGSVPAGTSSTIFLPMATPVRVPPGKLWYVWNATARLTLAAGDSISGQIGIAVRSLNGTAWTVLGAVPLTIGVAPSPVLTVAVTLQSFANPRRFFVQGDEFGLSYGQMVRGALDPAGANVTIEVTEIDV